MFLICKVYDKTPILLDPEIIDYIMKITITDIYREIYKLPDKQIKSWHPRTNFLIKQFISTSIILLCLFGILIMLKL